MNPLGAVTFPVFTGARANMMPVIHGRPDTYPGHLRQYAAMASRCDLKEGDTVYLTVKESWVEARNTQRRPGIHTDGTNTLGWGGGGWGKSGIFLASTDGRCRVWDSQTHNVDGHGYLLHEPEGEHHDLEPSRMYQISDRTPHESLRAQATGRRQFFRLVGPDIGGWWEQHSTANPLGIQPGAKVLTGSKFEVAP